MASAYEIACDSRPLVVAIVSCFVWVAGIPLAIFTVLYRNKRHLFAPNSDKHEIVVREYGTLYLRKLLFLVGWLVFVGVVVVFASLQ